MVVILHEDDWRGGPGQWRRLPGFGPGPVLVIVGDAGAMSAAAFLAAQAFVEACVIPIVERHEGAIVDGGTSAGIMAVVGQCRQRAHRKFQLLGVAPVGRVALDRSVHSNDLASPEPGHGALMLVHGDAWGDECGPMTEIAASIANGFPIVEMVFGGGAVTRRDVDHAVARGWPVVAIDGTGRVAEALADAVFGRLGQDVELAIWAASVSARVRLTAVPVGARAWPGRDGWFEVATGGEIT